MDNEKECLHKQIMWTTKLVHNFHLEESRMKGGSFGNTCHILV
jgi:hypothetical protein